MQCSKYVRFFVVSVHVVQHMSNNHDNNKAVYYQNLVKSRRTRFHQVYAFATITCNYYQIQLISLVQNTALVIIDLKLQFSSFRYMGTSEICKHENTTFGDRAHHFVIYKKELWTKLMIFP